MAKRIKLGGGGVFSGKDEGKSAKLRQEAAQAELDKAQGAVSAGEDIGSVIGALGGVVGTAFTGNPALIGLGATAGEALGGGVAKAVEGDDAAAAADLLEGLAGGVAFGLGAAGEGDGPPTGDDEGALLPDVPNVDLDPLAQTDAGVDEFDFANLSEAQKAFLKGLG